MPDGRGANPVNAESNAVASTGSCSAGPSLPAARSALASVAASGECLRFVVVGFNPTERLLIEGAVLRSQRRSPRLQMLEPMHGASADVVIVDAQDHRAVAWATRQPNLIGQAVVWVDAALEPHGHLLAHRPAPWVALPAMLTQALEQHACMHRAHATQRPASPERYTGGPVLVVEHRAAARAELAALMKSRGVAAVAVADALAAIDAIALTRFSWALLGSLSDTPQLGLDSLRACRRIKAAAPSLPVVMLAHQTIAFDHVRAQAAGAAALLTMPFDAGRLYHAIDGDGLAAASSGDAFQGAVRW
jgi:CheY-like chemotaxis protein